MHVPCPKQRLGNTYRSFLVCDSHVFVGARLIHTYQFHSSSSFNGDLNNAGCSTNMADNIWSTVSTRVHGAIRGVFRNGPASQLWGNFQALFAGNVALIAEVSISSILK